MEVPPFDDLGIVGLGLIGGSVALAAKRRWPAIRIKACDPAPLAQEAVSQGLITSIVDTPSGLANCELIVIATPVQKVSGIIAELAEAGSNALVTDTASTKRTVIAAAESASNLLFVGGHPMAGSETPGLAGARADLFDGRPWLLVSAAPGREAKEAMLTTFVVGLGAKPEWTDAVTHDRVIAHVNHAPHVVSTALQAARLREGDGGQGGASSKDAAAMEDEGWQGVLDTNADFIADALTAMVAKLPTSSSTLMETPEVRDIFERAKALKTTP